MYIFCIFIEVCSIFMQNSFQMEQNLFFSRFSDTCFCRLFFKVIKVHSGAQYILYSFIVWEHTGESWKFLHSNSPMSLPNASLFQTNSSEYCFEGLLIQRPFFLDGQNLCVIFSPYNLSTIYRKSFLVNLCIYSEVAYVYWRIMENFL